MKKGFKLIVNIYSALIAGAAIIFGVVMSSGLFVFFGFALLLIVFLGLRKAIYSTNVTCIQHGSCKEIEIRSKDGSLLYEFSAE